LVVPPASPPPDLPAAPELPLLPDLPRLPAPPEPPEPMPPADGAPTRFGIDPVPARAPPRGAPSSPHPCRGAQNIEPTGADPGAFLSPDVGDVSRGAGLHIDARSCAPAEPRDPILRPD
jgi:hypothetical protein